MKIFSLGRKITGTDIKNYFEGKFLLWCEYHAPNSAKDPPSNYQDLLRKRGTDFEKAWMQKHYPYLQEVRVETTEEMMATLKKGEAALYHLQLVCFEKRLLGIPDLFIRKEGKSGLGDFHYEIIEVKSAKNIKRKHVMQACFYSYILGLVQGVFPSAFTLINCEGKALQYPYEECCGELLQALTEIEAIQEGKIIEPSLNTAYP